MKLFFSYLGFSSIYIHVYPPIYSHYHNRFYFEFLKLISNSGSSHIRFMSDGYTHLTWDDLHSTRDDLNTNISWSWIRNSIWREKFTCMLPITDGISLCCFANTKLWSTSLTLYSTCITNGICLFALVISMGALAS